METLQFIQDYLADSGRLSTLLDCSAIEDVIDSLCLAYTNNKHIFIFGNGGSASIANHFASDLNSTTLGHSKNFIGKRFHTISLSANISELTAWANDTGYENIYSGPLGNLVNEGDVIIAISSSGNSKNILRAVELAKERGAYIIGMAGMNGGELKNLADKCVIVPSDHYGHIEGNHEIIAHLITFALKERMNQE